MSWDTLIGADEVAPRYLEAAFCLDGRLTVALNQANARLMEARAVDARAGGVHVTAKAAQAELDEAKAAVDAAQTVIRVETIPEAEWRGIVAQHPPTADQRKAGHIAHPDKFPLAAVARCISQVTHRDRVMVGRPPIDWVTDLRDNKLTAGEWEYLCGLVQQLNQGVLDVGKLVGATGSRPRSETSLTSAAPEGSPTASS